MSIEAFFGWFAAMGLVLGITLVTSVLVDWRRITSMNIRNIRLVKFPDGTYGVRRGWFVHDYLDTSCTVFWWSKGDVGFNHCKTGSYAGAVGLYEMVRDRDRGKEEVIK